MAGNSCDELPWICNRDAAANSFLFSLESAVFYSSIRGRRVNFQLKKKEKERKKSFPGTSLAVWSSHRRATLEKCSCAIQLFTLSPGGKRPEGAPGRAAEPHARTRPPPPRNRLRRSGQRCDQPPTSPPSERRGGSEKGGTRRRTRERGGKERRREAGDAPQPSTG